jgi:non-homologous end joining protein Ku
MTTLKNSEEFKGLVAQFNQEQSNKLEQRMTDMVQRLLLEQEERMKGYEDIKY